MILKLGMKNRLLELYIICINDDAGLTLSYFTTRSNLVVFAFEWVKLLNSHLIGKLTLNDQLDRRFML